ncbi:MAG: TIGR03668 family PPOX class F420-dependent oxidoreductase [Actinomycetota bacterium]
MELQEMRRRVAEARVGRLATIDPDGRPNVVPFVFVLDGETLYSSVDEKPKRTRRLRRLENLRRDPRFTVLVDHYEEEWPRVWWVRLRGQGRVIEEGTERDHAIRLLGEKYRQYEAEAPQGSVMALDVEEWRGWAYSG